MSGIRLYLDDIRPLPEGFNCLARTAEVAWEIFFNGTG